MLVIVLVEYLEQMIGQTVTSAADVVASRQSLVLVVVQVCCISRGDSMLHNYDAELLIAEA